MNKARISQMALHLRRYVIHTARISDSISFETRLNDLMPSDAKVVSVETRKAEG